MYEYNQSKRAVDHSKMICNLSNFALSPFLRVATTKHIDCVI